jgi:GNAT superfamily N-acetyltransferase
MYPVRKALPEDLENLSLIFDAYRIFYKKETDQNGAKHFLSERILNHESEIFIALDGEIIVGFVQLYPIFSSTRMKRLWLLNDLFVHTAYRKKGIAGALINQSKFLCEQTNACGLVLETAKTNMEGNRLYPKMGFQADVEHQYYYWDC